MVTHEFRVRVPSSISGFEKERNFPVGWIGEEVRRMEPREGQRYLRFNRPFRPNLQTGVVVTDEDNGMWIPNQLLESADPVIAQ